MEYHRREFENYPENGDETDFFARSMIGKAQPSLQNWVVVAFGFSALSLAFSARAALGLVMPVWQRDLGWSSGFISGVGASALIVMAMIAPFAGRLVDRKGPRFTLSLGLTSLALGCALVAVASNKIVFAIAFGGFCGIGFGIVAVHVVSTAVVRVFESKQGLATGVATSGATAGQFLIVPMIAGLLTFASWRWGFAGLAISCFLLVPCVLWFMDRPSETQDGRSVSKASRSSIVQDVTFIITKPTFHILFWSFLICGFTTTGVIETHLLPYASYCGFRPIPSATAYGLLSAVNMIGMIAAGWLTDRVNRPLLLASIYALRALTFWLLSNVAGANVEMLFLFAALFGVVDYSTVPVTVSLVASQVGLRVMGLALGMISAGHSIGGALGAFFGGYVFDTTGNYDLVWMTSLLLAFGAGGLVLFLSNDTPRAAPA